MIPLLVAASNTGMLQAWLGQYFCIRDSYSKSNFCNCHSTENGFKTCDRVSISLFSLIRSVSSRTAQARKFTHLLILYVLQPSPPPTLNTMREIVHVQAGQCGNQVRLYPHCCCLFSQPVPVFSANAQTRKARKKKAVLLPPNRNTLLLRARPRQRPTANEILLVLWAAHRVLASKMFCTPRSVEGNTAEIHFPAVAIYPYAKKGPTTTRMVRVES